MVQDSRRRRWQDDESPATRRAPEPPTWHRPVVAARDCDKPPATTPAPKPATWHGPGGATDDCSYLRAGPRSAPKTRKTGRLRDQGQPHQQCPVKQSLQSVDGRKSAQKMVTAIICCHHGPM